MRTTICRIVLAVCLGVLAASFPVAADDAKARVNAFYRALVEGLAQEHSRTQTIAELVKKDPKIADICLKVIAEKLENPGDREESFRYLEGKLKEGLLLAATGPSCGREVLGRLEELRDKTYRSDDRAFILLTIIRLCPERGKIEYHKLGDLYLAERQFGMAVEAYRKGLEMKDDEDSRKLLEKANGLLAAYRDGGSISPDQVKALFKDRRMAAVPGTVRRRVEMVNAAQTNRILFEEWSHDIRSESIPQLAAVGEALKESFGEHTNERILIEGHTDRRGDLSKNRVLSEKRAEAIRSYLVEHFGLDASRFVIKGFGPSKPFSPDETPQGLALNRRVEFKKLDRE
jgi:outer membrane protein OmpA-like peptidoglycan-associated protein